MTNPNSRLILLAIAIQGALSRPSSWQSFPPMPSSHGRAMVGRRTFRSQQQHHRCAFLSSFPTTAALKTATSSPSQKTILHATSKSKNKSKKSSNNKEVPGGGFGKPPPKKGGTSNTATAPIVYPDLDPQVRSTLLPSPDVSNNNLGTVLAEEMYDRLEDIYGLPQFNFGGEGAIFASIGVNDDNDEDDAGGGDVGGGSLFEDIMSSGATTNGNSALDDLLSPSSSSSSTASLFPNLESTSTTTTTSTTTNAKTTFDLNTIPPFTKFRVLHTDPMLLAIDDFFTHEECDAYVKMSVDSEQQQQQQEVSNNEEENNNNNNNNNNNKDLQPMLLGQSQTVGKDSRSKAQRTSTTWFHYYERVPELMAKASRLLGLEGIERWEEPQTVRYRRNEQFTWHLDALSPDEATNPSGAGQRVATLLVYLTDLPQGSGGATMFRDLGSSDDEPLKVRPKKGSALLFFPAAGGIPNAPFDIRTLHCGEVVAEDSEHEKWIAQLWLRQRNYAPTAPEGNDHGNAADAIGRYCESAVE